MERINPAYNFPIVTFSGSDNAKMLTRIFPENLIDIARKVETVGGEFPKGFIHTSTIRHEFTNYYNQAWTRDGGRGLIELARFGDSVRARAVAEYFSTHITHGDHFGRATVENEYPKHFETDGNALILIGCWRAYLINEKDKAFGKALLERLFPVFHYFEKGMNECTSGDLIPCESELSGNPNTPYVVYGIYPNFAALCAIAAFENLADDLGDIDKLSYLNALEKRLAKGIEEKLISGKTESKTEQGAFINGIDENGAAFDTADWEELHFDAYCSTRQLCGILLSDVSEYGLSDSFEKIHRKTFDYINREMAKSPYYRKYGFVGVNCFHGAGGRHDETMCGYGQSFFTQAALLADNTSAATKLIDGMCRLAYDGDVVIPLTNDMSPFIFHECFNYENFEQGLDHTFGVLKNSRPHVSDNPGDEGNLVQEAEAVKVIALIIGVENTSDGKLRLVPRLPWDFDGITVKNYPFIDRGGRLKKLDFFISHHREQRCCTYSLHSDDELEDIDIRIGPFPYLCNVVLENNMSVEKGINSTFVWVKGLSGRDITGSVCLDF